MRYHRQLMNCILYDKIQIAKAVNVTMISLDEAPQGYRDFDKGAAQEIRDRSSSQRSSVSKEQNLGLYCSKGTGSESCADFSTGKYRGNLFLHPAAFGRIAVV
jgi:hypothetical protein